MQCAINIVSNISYVRICPTERYVGAHSKFTKKIRINKKKVLKMFRIMIKKIVL